MNIVAILFLFLLSSPVLAHAPPCRTEAQCDYELLCYKGFCRSINEIFAKPKPKPSSQKNNRNTGWRNDGLSGHGGCDGRHRFYDFDNYE